MISALILAATLAANIEKVEADYTAITNAIAAKGVVPTAGLNNSSNDIMQISVGGEWTKPTDWPDIKKILNEDTETGYAYKYITLWHPKVDKVVLRGASKYKLSDGTITTTSQTYDFRDKTNYKWVISYSNGKVYDRVVDVWYNPGFGYVGCALWIVGNGSSIINCFNGKSFAFERYLQSIEDIVLESNIVSVPSTYAIFANCPTLQNIKNVDIRLINPTVASSSSFLFYFCTSLSSIPSTLDVSQCTSVESMFAYCYKITSVPENFDISTATTAKGLFNNCYSLKTLPTNLNFSHCTTVENTFRGCSLLTFAPQSLNLTDCTNSNNMFYDCTSLTNCPSQIIANGNNNLAISFSTSQQITKESVEFLADGINDLSGSTKPPTVTFASAVRNQFTAEEWAVIVNKFTAKGWNLSPAS